MVRNADHGEGGPDADWESFAGLRRMANHWDRPGWHVGRKAYYWYIAFRHERKVQVLAADCQAVVSGPHFDLVEPDALHMTLEKISWAEHIDHSGIENVGAAASRRLHRFESFTATIGPLAGSAGALSFSVSPRARLSALRMALLQATQEAGFAAEVEPSDPFRPHVGIAYCNQTVDARPIIEQVQSLRSLRRETVRISKASLVVLTRNERSYSWDAVHQVPLAPPVDTDVSSD